MDNKQTIEHIRLKFDHAVQKKMVRERIQQKLIIACDGGMFKITQELMIYMSMYVQAEDDMIIEDINRNPIKIINPTAFLNDMRQQYKEVMNEWHMEYERMKRVRKIEDLK